MATDEKEPTGDEPITCNRIVRVALEGTDLPALGTSSVSDWVKSFDDPETQRRVGFLVQAAALADVQTARHWAQQADDAYRRAQAAAAARGTGPR